MGWHISRWKGRKAGVCAGAEAERLAYGQVDGKADKIACALVDGQAGKHVDLQTNRLAM
jgi:hypothetical protein